MNTQKDSLLEQYSNSSCPIQTSKIIKKAYESNLLTLDDVLDIEDISGFVTDYFNTKEDENKNPSLNAFVLWIQTLSNGS